MRKLGPDGEELPPTAYVFGNVLGERLGLVRALWERARVAAKLGDFHLADLRHEAASRFDEAGVPINFVSKILGHTNLTTTSRYLNIHPAGCTWRWRSSRSTAGLQTACKHRNPPKANPRRHDARPGR